MNKLFSRLSIVILAVAGSVVSASQAFAEVSGRSLVADMAPADLSAVISRWPYLVLIGAILIVLLCLVNIFYRIKEKK